MLYGTHYKELITCRMLLVPYFQSINHLPQGFMFPRRKRNESAALKESLGAFCPMRKLGESLCPANGSGGI